MAKPKTKRVPKNKWCFALRIEAETPQWNGFGDGMRSCSV